MLRKPQSVIHLCTSVALQKSPWYQQPTQGWYSMVTRAVPRYVQHSQLPTVRRDVPSAEPNPQRRRPPLKRRSTPCLRGYRGVALLVLVMVVIMISAIGYTIHLAGEY